MNDIARKNLSERTIAMNKARMKNYDGYKFEHLTVIRRDHKDEKGRYRFLCKCDCGKEIFILGGEIGKTKSCGCKNNEYISKTHGESNTRLYDIWHRMKERCYRKNHKSYADYGGRGITVCPEWRTDFVSFRNWAYANGYDKNAEFMKCTLDRIDVNGNYEPSNCRWVDMKVQCRNRRNNKYITCDGVKRTIAEWSEITGIRFDTLWRRIEDGWPDEKVIKTPLRRTLSQTKSQMLEMLKENEWVALKDFASIVSEDKACTYINQLIEEGNNIVKEWKYDGKPAGFANRYRVYRLVKEL